MNLSQARAAVAELEERRALGKVVVVPDAELTNLKKMKLNGLTYDLVGEEPRPVEPDYQEIAKLLDQLAELEKIR